jgi:hypothetical protein
MTQEEIFEEMQKMLAKIPSIVEEIKRIQNLGETWYLDNYDIENGYLFINLVEYWRGDTDTAGIILPGSAIWDESWVQKYEIQYKEEVEAERKRSEKQRKTLEAETTRQEKAQYEKLKKKFEG